MIYLASSWRNPHFDGVVDCFEQCGIEIYNFKDSEGFAWWQLDPYWETWNKEQYRNFLEYDGRVASGFGRDRYYLDNCDGLLLITPCGRSAHLELGYVAGLGKPTCIYLKEDQEPELMYKLASEVVTSITEVMAWAASLAGAEAPA